ncbi:endonuclease YncB(thermonuclease family) [Marmoricola sp. OAE513]|uniref:thermonuclease family protein n=1 Tax=Marmoricola sp. OAE513 TaxID=2817894 RepID=UPI001AE8FCC5
MLRTAASALTIALLVTVAPVATASAQESAPRPTAVKAKVVRWSDGDTVVTSFGKIRVIGVDTPETGKCGAKKAKALALKLAPVGSIVTLGNPASVQDTDRYGRKLRYVNRGKIDIALRQIKAGSRARYDSKDGYDHHPRQAKYRKADKKYKNYLCAKSSGSHGTSYAPVAGTWNCPSYARIKGNRGSNGWIYHVPGQQYYSKTNPEECFKTEAAARAAGYRRSKV